MTERPIIFSGPMVRALLAGRKTQTRRVLKLPRGMAWYPDLGGEASGWYCDIGGKGWWQLDELRCPYGKAGERLWVRETFAAPWGLDYKMPGGQSGIFYRADEERKLEGDGRWKPAIHMPRAVCRLHLEVTGVRIERLFDITEADCRAEGMLRVGKRWSSDEGQPTSDNARRAFEDLWRSINGAWLDCWVWVIEFKREGKC